MSDMSPPNLPGNSVTPLKKFTFLGNSGIRVATFTRIEGVNESWELRYSMGYSRYSK